MSGTRHCPEPVLVKGYAWSPSVSNILSHWQTAHPIRITHTLQSTKSDCHPRYKSTSHHLSSISSIKKFYISAYIIVLVQFYLQIYLCLFYNPNLVVQFMYIKSTIDQQIEQGSTFCILSFQTVSNLSCNCTHRHHQPPTLPTLKNNSPLIVWLCNNSLLIVIMIINCRLIVLKLEHFSSFIHNHLHIYYSLTNCKGRVNLDLTLYLVLILVQGCHKCITGLYFNLYSVGCNPA